MKIQHLLILPVLLILLSSCKKDDPIVEQEDTASYIKATFNWQQDILDLAQITTVSDSLPTVLDLVNDDSNTITLETVENGIDFAAFAQDPDGLFDSESVLIAFERSDEDTLALYFEIYGDLAVKSFSYATAAQMEAYYEDDVDFPNGTVIPYLISDKSETSNGIAFAGFFGAIDFGSSTFGITEIDESNNEFTGNFTFDWELIDEDDGNISLLKVTDGVFNKLKLVK